ncbi:MAG TPA: ATP synthase F1 subunit delta [Flavobacterium sp.]|jgi:F-type H+-transporting ATPase subunit delta|nr:ATP synthase F1 subunit delta [Flavobacterium sp.]
MLAANRYAKAILDTALSKNAASEVNDDMTLVASTIGNNEELKTFILSPTSSNDVKHSILLEIFSNVNPVTQSLFRLLFENKRFELLQDLATSYSAQFDKMNGIEIATVTTAIPMDAAMEDKVRAKILTISDKEIAIRNIVDPAIIGGFILRIGDNQYNASVAYRLEVLRRELSN